MNKLTETELETIIGGVALPSYFNQFRNSQGKIFIQGGNMKGHSFTPYPGNQGGTLNRNGDSVEGLTRMLNLHKRTGCTHVILGSKKQVFAINDVLAKLG